MRLKQLKIFSLLIVCFTLLAGCATVDNRDPAEGFNRAMYDFNDILDTFILRPAAKGYDYVTPVSLQKGLNNFFFNIGGPRTVVNDVLQGKFNQAGNDAGRFLINTTLGILGFFDVATHIGFTKNEEDFGQTLAVWGWENPAYLVLPFFGPSTLRDAPAKFTLDRYLGPYPYIDDDAARYGLLALDVVETRHRLLDLDETVEEQLDPYTYIRDIYLERRQKAIDDMQEDEPSAGEATVSF